MSGRGTFVLQEKEPSQTEGLTFLPVHVWLQMEKSQTQWLAQHRLRGCGSEVLLRSQPLNRGISEDALFSRSSRGQSGLLPSLPPRSHPHSLSRGIFLHLQGQKWHIETSSNVPSAVTLSVTTTRKGSQRLSIVGSPCPSSPLTTRFFLSSSAAGH